ncbi:MAG: hypothetical protein IKR73_03795 [Oscillospiraceae bacterium]|nr:hypothetical protein [Oscillospiraceae bacterium]
MLRYLSPFASDISGAASVLYEMGGITVICDAGGCTGNVSGFDEPRMGSVRSAVFSAGMRDMDAVMGDEDGLCDKILRAYDMIGGELIALVGTPVPSVIAQDSGYMVRRLSELTGAVCISIGTTGTRYYDKGAEEAYLKLFAHAREMPRAPGKVGVVGCTPLDVGMDVQLPEGHIAFGMGSGFDEIRHAARCERMIVCAPCGVAAARYMEERFGIPYEVGYPFPLPDVTREDTVGKTLIIHQQFAANALREHTGGDTASFFMMLPDYMREGDRHIHSEDELREVISRYDTVIADSTYRRAVPDFDGRWIGFTHYAVSGW